MRNASRAVLIDERAGREPIEGEWRGDRVRLSAGNGMRKNIPAPWNGLEAPSSPAAADKKVLDGRLTDDWAGVRADVDDAAPLAKHLHPAEYGKQLEQGAHLPFDDPEAPALRVR